MTAVAATARQLARIADVYDALLAPERCAPMLQRLAAQCGARAAALSLMGNSGAEGDAHFMTPPFDDAVFEDYFARFGAAEARARARMDRLDPMRWVSEAELYGVPAAHDPVLAWLREHFDLGRRSGVRLNEDRAYTDMLTLFFDAERGPVTSAEQAFIAPVLPHLAKFAQMNRPFDLLRRRYGAVMDALDRLLIGVAVLLDTAGVVLMNREAERICDLASGVAVTRDRRVVLADDAAQRRFRAALDAAVETARGVGAGLSASVAAPRTGGGDPFLLDISAVRGTDAELDPGLRAALVFMVDPANTRPVRVENMQALYNLTPAEAAVLKMVVEGAPAPEIAACRETSVATARAQLRAIAVKTGAPNRAALVRLALTVNPPVEAFDAG